MHSGHASQTPPSTAEAASTPLSKHPSHPTSIHGAVLCTIEQTRRGYRISRLWREVHEDAFKEKKRRKAAATQAHRRQKAMLCSWSAAPPLVATPADRHPLSKSLLLTQPRRLQCVLDGRHLPQVGFDLRDIQGHGGGYWVKEVPQRTALRAEAETKQQPPSRVEKDFLPTSL